MYRIEFYSTRGKYGCFSNFSRHPVLIDGKQWPTSEHYFQAMKFHTRNDIMEHIRCAGTPTQAKRLGWNKTFPFRSDWDAVKDDIMYRVCYAKFTQNESCKKTLMDTGDTYLIENAPRDAYWGCGADGNGKNQLGHTLMRVRGDLTSS
jgi:ribA/ribD-fused uncharacterized protein